METARHYGDRVNFVLLAVLAFAPPQRHTTCGTIRMNPYQKKNF